MSKLRSYLAEIASAIREKKGTSEPINAKNFKDEILNLPSGGSGWTGHADVEGLKAIGWDDEDIAYYQKYGVNWDEEDDEFHKVSEDNKALYGVLTANNISTYKDRIVYLPKIDTSAKTSMSDMFRDCYSLVAVPLLDTSNVTNMNSTFANCYSLVYLPPFNTSKVATMSNTFNYCVSLIYIAQLDTRMLTNLYGFLSYCYSLKSFPKINTDSVTNMGYMCAYCWTMSNIPHLNMSKVTNINYIFFRCYPLSEAYITNLNSSLDLSTNSLFGAASLLYLINNEAATAAITITLHAAAYDRAMANAEILAALEAHPNVSLASA